ncbi:4'-phosphopantetheinyl transferase superfamily protein [Staphylococcus capitis]|uniref:4'-phosphopantetheinyl transferase superfamily protein n=1 Tax=Staphylococcus capitis TaxID=29388 RepID=UPI003AFAE241
MYTLTTILKLHGIIKKFFSLKEQKYINSLSNNEKKINEYFKLWTQKESFVKCLGTGFFHHILNTNMVSDDKPLNKKIIKVLTIIFTLNGYKINLSSPFAINLKLKNSI